MEKKTVLVTGGSRGIGHAICRGLGEAGFRVGIHFNSSSAPAEELQKSIPDSFIVQADLSTVEGADKIYDFIKGELKSDLYGLVNNAGFTIDNPIFSASLEEFDKIVNTNMRSTWYLTKRLSRFMIRKKEGRVVNISSVVGFTGNPTQSIYGMTKAAIDNFTKVAAMEFSPYNILVNSVAPGFIETDMTQELGEDIKEKILSTIPLGRMGKPEEIAETVRFLMEGGSYITGTVLHVNGGMYSG